MKIEINGHLYSCFGVENAYEHGYVFAGGAEQAQAILCCDACNEEDGWACSGPRLYGKLKGILEVEK